MPVLTILLVIICAGVAMYAVNRFVPMEPTFKNIFNVVVVCLVVFWLLKVFGVLHALQAVKV